MSSSSTNVSNLEEEMLSLFQVPLSGSYAKFAPKMAAKLNTLEEEFMSQQKICQADVTPVELAKRFNSTSMSQQPSLPSAYLDTVVGPLVGDSIHCCAPTMIGHMTTSLPYYMRPLAKLLTTLHCNNVKVETGKASTFLEKEALAMLHRTLFGLDDDFYKAESERPDVCLGVITSGGTIANNTAMWIARNKLFKPSEDGKYRGCDKQGMIAGLAHYGYKGACIIGSQVMHYSMKKSADVLGIGIEGLKTVPFGPDYRVDIKLMREALEECKRDNIAVLALVGVAGGTETGSIDDLDAIADLADEFKVHFHADAAWGGPVIFSEQHKHKIKGIERADTVTLDGHKQLYTPMGCGICFLRDPLQIHSVQKTANYIIRKDSYDLGKFTMEGSRPAVSLFLHANLKVMGVQGYGALVDRSIRLVQHMVKALRATGEFETVLEPMTNILLYRYLPNVDGIREASKQGKKLTQLQNLTVDEYNVNLQNAQKAAGKTFVSRTTIYQTLQNERVVALRVVIANPLTTENDVDTTLADQLAIVAKQIEMKEKGTKRPLASPAPKTVSPSAGSPKRRKNPRRSRADC